MTKSPQAARRAADTILRSVASLDRHAERGVEVSPGLRELHVSFGRDGYVARYRIDDGVVFVTRIFHTREAR